MRKIYLLFSCLAVLALSSAFVLSSGGGLAGYTNSPGEANCTSCHTGGQAPSASGITLTAVPAFSLNEYRPDSVYQISISASAAGYSRYGFGCEVLNQSLQNAGTLTLPGPGVKFINAFNGRRNAVQTLPKNGASVTFTFQWFAPSTGTVTFYTMVNAVNGNNNTSGDFPLTPFSLKLRPWIAPVDTTEEEDTSTVSIPELNRPVGRVVTYPNPAGDNLTVEYSLEKKSDIEVLLRDLTGRLVAVLVQGPRPAGVNREPIGMGGTPRGVYFIEVSDGHTKPVRKLVMLR
jgi:hypothetical protein